ncbi:ISL3 family transposase [Spirosoma endbachense]|uniref:ISL3 family transposase n=1 Tax=Spirosoma endbachense TaxID=2666025 RepID=A0A6P1W7R5_9BACT|nr:ISL3 family transposase [Spirosoma endbachense]QHW01066.1 ISL3 family transposase [Spirosoma endbachense]
MLSSLLLPFQLEVQTVTSQPNLVIVALTSTALFSNCPLCGTASHRIHSRYNRTLADLPLAGQYQEWRLKARKFFCDNLECPRRIFTERFESIIQPYARCTQRCIQQQAQLMQAVGARPGQRMGALFRLPASNTTLLRRLRVQSMSIAHTPRVLGVDDFAFRKGDRYGTILVDLETHQVVDLLPDRETAALKNWLNEHPGVEVVSRDRASTYALAAAQAAPQAIQVADRWHLLKNLGEAIQRFVESQRVSLQQATQELVSATAESPVVSLIDNQMVDKDTPSLFLSSRQAKFDQVKTLRQQGYSILGIAKQLKLSRNTVKKYLVWSTYPARARVSLPRRSSGILAFEDYIRQRWQEGEQRSAYLYTEVRQQGFSGSKSSVFRLVKDYPRKAQLVLPLAAKPVPYSVRQISRWLSLPLESLSKATDRAFMDQFFTNCPLAQKLHKLAVKFRTMMEERQVEHLDSWLMEAQESGISALRHFSANLSHDYQAVRQAFCSVWSNGQVEGQVNRLKTIKRTMYGRASFDLLRKRVVGLG